MEDIKNNIALNIIELRKNAGYSQLELAQKIGYSDKAVSRWETGEVTPDIDTLECLAALYELPLTALFEEYNAQKIKSYDYRRLHIGKKLAIVLLAVAVLWYLTVMRFMWNQLAGVEKPWMAFIWAIPLTFLLTMLFNVKWGYRPVSFVLASGLCWGTVLGAYLHFLEYNMYMLFISGVPMQICIILWMYVRPPKSRPAVRDAGETDE